MIFSKHELVVLRVLKKNGVRKPMGLRTIAKKSGYPIPETSSIISGMRNKGALNRVGNSIYLLNVKMIDNEILSP